MARRERTQVLITLPVVAFIATAIVICSFGHRLQHPSCSAELDSAFYPRWDGKWVSAFRLSNRCDDAVSCLLLARHASLHYDHRQFPDGSEGDLT